MTVPTEPWVMCVHGTAVEWFDRRPMFLASYDLEAPDPVYGWGTVVLTTDPDEALHFDDAGAVMRVWKVQSRTVPWRSDGKANRPLTRYSIEPQPLSRAKTKPGLLG